jgi:RNA polymerase sigma-70 factor (ECF subfamily)
VEKHPQQLLAEARAGQRESLGLLLERYRAYLRALACAKLDGRLQARANPSDLVQETFLIASRRFGQFRGSSEGEWLQWLRRILRRRLLHFRRRHVRARKRNVYREIALGPEPNSSVRGPQLADHGSSPSASAQRRELAGLIAERLARLKPAYREVLVLRNLQGLGFEEVARRMHRSSGAVRILWLRALEQFRQLGLGEDLP